MCACVLCFMAAFNKKIFFERQGARSPPLPTNMLRTILRGSQKPWIILDVGSSTLWGRFEWYLSICSVHDFGHSSHGKSATTGDYRHLGTVVFFAQNADPRYGTFVVWPCCWQMPSCCHCRWHGIGIKVPTKPAASFCWWCFYSASSFGA